MKYVLGTLQVLLALTFIAAGGTKLVTSAADMAEMMRWTASVPTAMVRVIGIIEVAGGLGLVLPWLTGIQPQLVRLAAAGLVVTMIGAMITHVAIGDPIGELIPSFVLGLIAAFIAYGRTSVLPLPEPATA
ncbi:MAG: DoxX family protein [Anaerolineae bacterium]